jgi:hypothetical protein
VDPATIQRWQEGLTSGRITPSNYTPNAQPVTVTLAPEADTFIRSSGTTCLISGSPLIVGNWTDPDCPFQAQALLRFNLANIPTDATIEQATLELYLSQAYGSNKSLTIDVYRVDTEWSEMGAAWNNVAVYVTPYASTAIGQDKIWYAWDVTKLVSSWHTESLHNYGLLLRASSETTGDSRVFDSREGKNPPRLRVTYRQ